MPLYHLNLKTHLKPPYLLQKGNHNGNVYYHYTNEVGRQGIIGINAIRPSEKNTAGAPNKLCRTYFTDIPPELMRRDKVNSARKIFGTACFDSWKNKVAYCFVLNLSGLENIIQSHSPHIFYIKNTPFLPLKYKFQGEIVNRVIACVNVSTGLAIA